MNEKSGRFFLVLFLIKKKKNLVLQRNEKKEIKKGLGINKTTKLS